MAVTLADAVVYFKGDDKQLISDLNAAQKKTENAAGSMAKFLGGALVGAAAAAGAAIVGIGVAGVESFIDFQGKMNEVFTLLPGISQKGMDSMTEDVKKFAKEFGVLPDKVVPALYQALSSGIPPDNVFKFLEAAQKAAVGGVTDLTTAVDGISSVVNAYGADIIDATQASDLMFTAVKLGKTNFAELSQSLFNVIPTAASLGVKFGDITAALAAMTVQGVPTSVATTQLRQMLVDLSQATSKSSKAFEEASGKTFPDFIAAGGNLQDALKIMEGAAKSSNLRLSDLFGSVEAGQAALALTGQGTATFTSDLAQMGNASGATDAAFATMQGGIGKSIDRIKVAWAVFLLDTGQLLAPFVANLVEVAGPAISQALDDIITTVGNLKKAYAEDFGGMRTAAENFMTLDTSFDVFFGHVNRAFHTTSDDNKLTWAKMLAGLTNQFTSWVDFVLDVLNNFLDSWTNTQDAWGAAFKGDWSTFWVDIGNNFYHFANVLLDWIEIVFGPNLRQKLVDAMNGAWEGLKSLWTDFSDWWSRTFGALLGGVSLGNLPGPPSPNAPTGSGGGGGFGGFAIPAITIPSAGATNTTSKTVNIHPGAITVNQSKSPTETADEMLRILEGLAGS